MTNCRSLVLENFSLILVVLLYIVRGASSVSAATTPTSMLLPLPYSGPFEVVAVLKPSQPRDVQTPFTLVSTGFIPVAFQANKSFDELGDLDIFEMRDRLYAVQVQNPGAYVLTEVTNPVQPVNLGTWRVKPRATGEHIEAFRQDDNWYLFLPLEASDFIFLPCGLAIIEITDPLHPILQGPDLLRTMLTRQQTVSSCL